MKRSIFVLTVVFSVHASGCDGGLSSDACPRYLDCQAHFEDVNGLPATDQSETYGEGGTCWQNAETADSCTTGCESAVSNLKDELEAAGEDVGACG